MKQTIVIITNQLEPGGAEQFCLDISNRFTQRGYPVILFAQRGMWSKRVAEGVEYVDIPLRGARLSLIPMAWKIRAELKKRPEILGVLANSMASLLAIRLAYPLQRLPVIQVAHGWPSNRISIVGYTSRLANRVLAVSDNLRNALIEAGCNPDSIYHVPNGVDCEKFQPGMSVPRSQWRSEHGYLDEDCVLLSVARFEKEKRPDRLSSLAVAIKECGSVGLKVHAIGIGSLRSRLQQFVSEQKIQDVLRIQNGSDAEIASAIAGADMFLNTSDREAMPLSVLEGLAGGLPLIGNKDVLSELLDPRWGIACTGWVYNEIIRKVLEIWSDQNRYRMLSRAAREYALRHDFRITADAYEKHLWEIASMTNIE